MLILQSGTAAILHLGFKYFLVSESYAMQKFKWWTLYVLAVSMYFLKTSCFFMSMSSSMRKTC